ncbi:MAG: FAD-dependent oxidoreductase [Sphaerochaetaceae bacterium]
MEYVIIGNSIAAVGCIEGIRSCDKEGNITIISDEKQQCYSRPLISYYLLGKTKEECMTYRDDSFFTDNKVRQYLGTKVLKINAENKWVETDNIGNIKYDKLLVATGSRAFIPPMNNLESVQNKFSFMSYDDARQLKKVLTKKSKVLIIGAGLIGLKCAEGIRNLVASITVVDLAQRVLPVILDEEGSQRVRSHLEKNGLNFILGDSVASFAPNEATLTSGQKVAFDILVLAVGVRPNTSLVSECGGKVNRGIVIDDMCKTTLKDVYSAGDCTETMDIASGATHIIAIFPNARLQGETAGKNMAGENETFVQSIPMNATGLFGLHMITAGAYIGDPLEYSSKTGYKKLFTKDNHLVGFILVGDTIDRAGIYTSLVRNQVDLSTINFPLIAENPQLMAFARKDRAKKLGGVQ